MMHGQTKIKVGNYLITEATITFSHRISLHGFSNTSETLELEQEQTNISDFHSG